MNINYEIGILIGLCCLLWIGLTLLFCGGAFSYD